MFGVFFKVFYVVIDRFGNLFILYGFDFSNVLIVSWSFMFSNLVVKVK